MGVNVMTPANAPENPSVLFEDPDDFLRLQLTLVCGSVSLMVLIVRVYARSANKTPGRRHSRPRFQLVPDGLALPGAALAVGPFRTSCGKAFPAVKLRLNPPQRRLPQHPVAPFGPVEVVHEQEQVAVPHKNLIRNLPRF